MTLRRSTVAVALLAGVLALPGCASAASTAAPAGADFTITGYAFPAFTAAPGATITIADADGEPHTVTADDGSFDTGSFDGSSPGRLVVPTTPGTYPVHCGVHPSMHGTLTVR
jgi:plastocyanin